MNSFVQNLAVIVIVGLCIAYAGWQLIQAFRGRKSKLGSCCAKGCTSTAETKTTTPQAAPVQFLPLANLGRPRSK